MKERLWKRIGLVFGALTAALILAGLTTTAAKAGEADPEAPHVHCVCGNSASAIASDHHTCSNPDQVWTAVGTEAELKNIASGINYFYLTADIELTEAVKLTAGQYLYLCLNSHTITAAANARAFWFGDNIDAKFSFCDCQKSGTITAHSDTTGVSNGGNFYLGTGAKSDFYEITIANGKTTTCGGNFWINGVGADGIYFFHCTITGGNATRNAASTASGGNVYVNNASGAGDIWFIDTTISDGTSHNSSTEAKAYANGGNLSVRCSGTAQKAHFIGSTTITGGTASTAKQYTSGGNLTLNSGTAEIGSGVKISGGTSRSDGGNIHFGTNAVVTIDGATISGGNASTGGSISVENANVTIQGETVITGGKATSKGGNIYVKGTSTQVTIFGGTIKEGEMTNSSGSYGGNIAIDAGTLTMRGGTITNGKVMNANGYNLAVGYGSSTNGYATIYGGTISGALSGSKGNSVCTQAASGTDPKHGELTIHGGTFGNTVQSVGGVLTIDGGTFNNVAHHTGTTAISGGRINEVNATGASANATGSITVSGGYMYSFVRDASKYNNTITATLNGGFFVNEPDEAFLGTGRRTFPGTYQNTDTSDTRTYKYEVAEGYLIEVTGLLKDSDPPVAAGSNLEGGGLFRKGETFYASVSPQFGEVLNGQSFLGWFDADDMTAPLTTDNNYISSATRDLVLVALYEQTAATDCTILVTGGDYVYGKISNMQIVETAGTSAGFTAESGSRVRLTYTGEDAFNGWVNEYGKLLSRDREYWYFVTTDATLTALTDEGQSTKAVFFNKFNQVLSMKALAALTDADIPVLPTETGCVNGRWTVGSTEVTTADDVRAAKKAGAATVDVVARYDESGDVYTVTVIGVMKGADGTHPSTWERYATGDGTYTANIGKPVKLEEMNPGTGHFVCYLDENGKILSAYHSPNMRFADDRTIYGVYGTMEDFQAVVGQPLIQFVTAEKNGNVSTLEALRDVYAGDAMLEQGILFTTDAMRDGLMPEEVLKADSDHTYKYVSNGKDRNDTTGLTLKNVSVKIYARAYLVIAGTGSEVIYSEVVEIEP